MSTAVWNSSHRMSSPTMSPHLKTSFTSSFSPHTPFSTAFADATRAVPPLKDRTSSHIRDDKQSGGSINSFDKVKPAKRKSKAANDDFVTLTGKENLRPAKSPRMGSSTSKSQSSPVSTLQPLSSTPNIKPSRPTIPPNSVSPRLVPLAPRIHNASPPALPSLPSFLPAVIPPLGQRGSRILDLMGLNLPASSLAALASHPPQLGVGLPFSTPSTNSQYMNAATSSCSSLDKKTKKSKSPSKGFDSNMAAMQQFGESMNLSSRVPIQHLDACASANDFAPMELPPPVKPVEEAGIVRHMAPACATTMQRLQGSTSLGPDAHCQGDGRSFVGLPGNTKGMVKCRSVSVLSQLSTDETAHASEVGEQEQCVPANTLTNSDSYSESCVSALNGGARGAAGAYRRCTSSCDVASLPASASATAAPEPAGYPESEADQAETCLERISSSVHVGPKGAPLLPGKENVYLCSAPEEETTPTADVSVVWTSPEEVLSSLDQGGMAVYEWVEEAKQPMLFDADSLQEQCSQVSTLSHLTHLSSSSGGGGSGASQVAMSPLKQWPMSSYAGAEEADEKGVRLPPIRSGHEDMGMDVGLGEDLLQCTEDVVELWAALAGEEGEEM